VTYCAVDGFYVLCYVDGVNRCFVFENRYGCCEDVCVECVVVVFLLVAVFV